MSTTSILAWISVEPAVWPAGSLQDVTIRLILRNEGPKTALVYPVWCSFRTVERQERIR
jgi:hypothetical protein